MIRIALILSLVFTASASASIKNMSNDFDDSLEYELFDIFSNNSEEFHCSEFEVFEIEEEVEIPFDTKKYLPEGFNRLKGLHDVNWEVINLIEVEEEVEIPFDTKKYLPKNFNALEGLHDLDWDSIELVGLEEDVELNFDTKKFLPANFCPYVGMS